MALEEKIIKAIHEWQRGCSVAPPERPWECPECTDALIRHIEREIVRDILASKIGEFLNRSGF